MSRADMVAAHPADTSDRYPTSVGTRGLLLDSGCVLALPEPGSVWSDVEGDEDWDVVPYLLRVRGDTSTLLTSVSDVARRVGTTEQRVRTYCSFLRSAYTDPAVWRRAVPGAAELVSRACEAGMRIAVVSNSTRPMARDLLERIGRLDASFGRALGQIATIVDSAEVGLVKPEPRIFEHALRELGCSAATSVMIGDSVIEDVDGARGAGLTAYHYDPVGWCKDKAHEHLRSLSDLQPTLLVAEPPDRRS